MEPTGKKFNEIYLKNNFRAFTLVGMVSLIGIYYNILYDIILLILFLISAYSFGLFFKVKTQFWSGILIRICLGMGIIGFITHYFLLIGIGNKALFLVILMLPVFMQRRVLLVSVKDVLDVYNRYEHKIEVVVVASFTSLYFLFGNPVVRWADGLAKYLSVVMYAADTGTWKTNIIESIIYSDQFTMFCSLITFGVTLGSERFCIWISTLSMCITLLLLLLFIKTIYKKTSVLLTVGIFFTLPFFLRLGLDMCMDFLQVLFLMAAILCMADMDDDTVWDNLYPICFLCSCALFSKLTASYIILVLGIAVIILLGINVVRQKTKGIVVIKKLFCAAFWLVAPISVSISYGFHYMGSPVLPWMNGLFKSPYVAQSDFVDPFQNSPFGFNIQTLLNIVFKTSQNMEIVDGGMGIFLLFICLIPLAILLYRKKTYILWIVMAFIMFGLSTLFTYNLRYYIVIVVLMLGLICIAVSVVCRFLFKNAILCNTVILLIMSVNMVSNIYVINQAKIPVITLERQQELCEDDRALLLKKHVPEDSWVFGIGQNIRGEWKGVLYSDTWYNAYLETRMEESGITYKDIIRGFDYVLCRKGELASTEELQEIISSVGTEDSILESHAQSQDFIIYKVKDYPQKEIASFEQEEPMKIGGGVSYTYRIDDMTPESFGVSCKVTNPSESSVMVGYQIFYYDVNGDMLDFERYFVPVSSGEQVINASGLTCNNDAVYADFAFYTYDQADNVLLNQLILYVDKDRSYINSIVEEYYTRKQIQVIPQ